MPETVRSVLLIGHNPGLHELALALAGPAGMALAGPEGQRLAASIPLPRWRNSPSLRPGRPLAPGCGRLLRFLVPADLPEPAA